MVLPALDVVHASRRGQLAQACQYRLKWAVPTPVVAIEVGEIRCNNAAQWPVMGALNLLRRYAC